MSLCFCMLDVSEFSYCVVSSAMAYIQRMSHHSPLAALMTLTTNCSEKHHQHLFVVHTGRLKAMWKQNNNTDKANNCRVWSRDQTRVPMTVTLLPNISPSSRTSHPPPEHLTLLLFPCFFSSLCPTHCTSLPVTVTSFLCSSLSLLLCSLSDLRHFPSATFLLFIPSFFCQNMKIPKVICL